MMIIVGGFASISVGKLFMGGVFPGLLTSLFFVLYIGIRCWRQPELAPALPLEERANWKEKMISLRGVILPIILILLVLGTIYAGICTPSEAGGIGAFGAIICAIIYRRLNWKMLKDACFSGLILNAMIYLLIIGGNCFSSLMMSTGVSHFISDSLAGMTVSPILILAVMMVIPLIMGMFMDGAAITMILIPIFMPVVFQLGIDPLWFAILFTINLLIGYITPPFGMMIFVTKGIVPPDITMAQLYRAVLPFSLIMIVVLVICIVFPPILTWLPNVMIK